MRVLVTGGSGFIGSHVVDKLRAHGHEPVIYDLRESPWHTDDPVETIIGAVTDRATLERALEGCDAVAHLAAVADVNDVHAEPEDAEHVNSRGTAAVLEACRRAGVKRIVYASTIWVYSDTESDVVDEDTLLPPPAHLYTSTKLAGELYCKSYNALYGIDYTILRFGIPYGPRAREAAVVPAFVNKAFAGEALTLSGDGLQSRRFVYVEDLAEGVAAGFDDVAVNRVYNLVSDENVTIKQIAELVQEYIGNTEITYAPARPGDLGIKLVSGERARDELGWTAETPFRDGVWRYIEWRRQQAASLQASAPELDDDDLEGEPPLALAGAPESHDQATPLTNAVAAASTDSRPPRKILIVSADIGEGHDLPARSIAQEFKQEDPETETVIVNGLPVMGALATWLLRENSAMMFRWAPWLFDLQYRLFMRFPPTRWLARRMLTQAGSRGLMRLIRAYGPDAIVSTYPGTTAILGELRRRGRLRIPCYSSITDLAGLRYWAHPGIDLHFITHPESVEEVEQIAGPGSVRWARPPTSPAFMSPRDRDQARAALELPAQGTVIAVSGGGWGVGDLIGASAAALSIPGAAVMCLCGRNERVLDEVTAHFANEPRLRPVGFTEQMGDVMAAADALIHSSAGLTVLEAIIRGCPVISYGFGYGHIRASNAALERFGLAQVARSPDELIPALERALASRPEPDASFATRPATALLVRGNERRARVLPTWRVRATHALTAGAATLAAAWIALSLNFAYTLVSAVASTKPLTAVTTPKAQVGVMIDVSASDVRQLAEQLSVNGLHASFALSQAPDADVDAVSDMGDQALPLVNDGGLVGWLATRHRLHELVHELGWGHHFLYTSTGTNFGQWLLAHGDGGKLVEGHMWLTRPGERLGDLRAGEVIEVRIQSLKNASAEVRELKAALRHSDLQGVSVGELLKDSGTSV